MNPSKHGDFGGEVSRILPLILREVTKKQMTIFSKGRLALPHVVILDLLAENGPCKMGDLAKTLHLTMSAVTGIVDRMIQLDLVKRERSREDRRVVRVSLLKKGEEAAKRVNEERRNTANDIFSPLTESERGEYLRILRKVYDNLRKKQ
ncbi:MarR family winged helix-turn-helix transcriptional regulator [Candidatus Omnitrophota bacterium]